jgi:hypothetical protein
VTTAAKCELTTYLGILEVTRDQITLSPAPEGAFFRLQLLGDIAEA